MNGDIIGVRIVKREVIKEYSLQDKDFAIGKVIEEVKLLRQYTKEDVFIEFKREGEKL